MTDEQKQVIRFSCEVFACLLVSTLLIISIMIVSRNPDGYGAALIPKMKLLNDAPDPRVIFVGGSGTSFGVDSDVIKSETGLNPVNLGLYVGFGMQYMLDQAASGIRTGDIVVLIPEYNALSDGPEAQGFYVLESMQYDPRFGRFALSNRDSLIDTVREFPTWFSTRVYSTIGRTLEPVFPHSDTLYRRVYRASTFNQYGDNDGAIGEQYVLPASEFESGSSTILAEGLDPNVLRAISAFIGSAEAHGIQVYISWPVLPRSVEAQAHANVVAAHQEMRRTFGDRILGSPADFIFEDADFFDSVNHLRPNARTVRSLTLSHLLTSKLRATSETP